MKRGQAIQAGDTRWASGRRMQRIACLITMPALVMLVPGCLPETKPGFDSPAPSKRLDAIVDASRLEDDESLVKLVEKLRSPAPAERMFAIRSLEIRTSETLGYDHAAEHWQRIAAYNRWLGWLEQQGIRLPDTMTPEPERPTKLPAGQPGSSEGTDEKQPMEPDTPQD